MGRQGVILFDGDCPLCQRSVAIARRLDWLGKLGYQNARTVSETPVGVEPGRLLEEMHLLAPNGKVHVGYDAWRWIAWRLPATFLLAPFLYFPGVPWIGKKIYLWVAKNRLKLVPCHDGACQIPLPKK